MFKKKPQIKNLSSLRSSDRRKLADQIIKEYGVSVPAPSEASTGEELPPKDPPTVTLTSIRAALLPDNCSSAKFATHSGPDAKLVTGTLYVGSHPDQEERILWWQSNSRIYPTVYTLWNNPGLIPLLHTGAVVVDKLRAGADLMTPGLTRGPPFPESAKKNSVVAVASLERPSVPTFVGICEIDVGALQNVRGVKGHAVRSLHWEGDEVWFWTSKGVGGRHGPDHLDGWDSQKSSETATAMEKMTLEDDDSDEEDGGVSLQPDTGDVDEPDEPEPPTPEIDEAFEKAFVYALYNARKTGSSPHYGLDLPILPSYLIARLVQSHLPNHSPSLSQYYTIKKTGWKNTKKFIKHLEKKGLVKSKDRNGGETVIIDVDFNDSRIRDFTPYPLPKAKAQINSEEANESTSDPSIGQKLKIQILIRPSPKLVPDLIPSKTDYYTVQQITTFLREYVESNPSLTTGTTSSRFLKLDPFLSHLLRPADPSDAKILSTGQIARDILNRRILEDTHLCQPYWLLLHNDQTWSPDTPDPSLPKPKPGSPPRISVTTEKRTGSKMVTKIAHLEIFRIAPDLLAADLQKKCASSTSVAQLMGGKPGMMEVLAQGDQRAIVERELGRRGVRGEWIEVVEKGGKGKGKKK